jgi:predicted small secreted protein
MRESSPEAQRKMDAVEAEVGRLSARMNRCFQGLGEDVREVGEAVEGVASATRINAMQLEVLVARAAVSLGVARDAATAVCATRECMESVSSEVKRLSGALSSAMMERGRQELRNRELTKSVLLALKGLVPTLCAEVKEVVSAVSGGFDEGLGRVDESIAELREDVASLQWAVGDIQSLCQEIKRAVEGRSTVGGGEEFARVKGRVAELSGVLEDITRLGLVENHCTALRSTLEETADLIASVERSGGGGGGGAAGGGGVRSGAGGGW